MNVESSREGWSFPLERRGKRLAIIAAGSMILTLENLNHALTWGTYDGTDASMSLSRYVTYFAVNASLLASAGLISHYAARYLQESYVTVRKNGEWLKIHSLKWIITKGVIRSLGFYTGAQLLSAGASSAASSLGCSCRPLLSPDIPLAGPVNTLTCLVRGNNCTEFSSTMNLLGRASFYISALVLIVYEIYFIIIDPAS